MVRIITKADFYAYADACKRAREHGVALGANLAQDGRRIIGDWDRGSVDGTKLPHTAVALYEKLIATAKQYTGESPWPGETIGSYTRRIEAVAAGPNYPNLHKMMARNGVQLEGWRYVTMSESMDAFYTLKEVRMRVMLLSDKRGRMLTRWFLPEEIQSLEQREAEPSDKHKLFRDFINAAIQFTGECPVFSEPWGNPVRGDTFESYLQRIDEVMNEPGVQKLQQMMLRNGIALVDDQS